MVKYVVNWDMLNENIEAKNFKEAKKIVMDLIDIQEDEGYCVRCEKKLFNNYQKVQRVIAVSNPPFLLHSVWGGV